MYYFIAQFMGIAAMALNVVSYQAKSRRTVILFQLFGSLLFTLNMFMLGAVMGTIINTIGTVRGIVYSNRDKIKNITAVNAVFILLYVLSYVATFMVFKLPATTFNLIVEVLPVFAMSATTIAFSMKNVAGIRRVTLLSPPLWGTYNVISGSIGGTLCEVLSFVSVISAIIRLDLKRGEENDHSKP